MICLLSQPIATIYNGVFNPSLITGFSGLPGATKIAPHFRLTFKTVDYDVGSKEPPRDDVKMRLYVITRKDFYHFSIYCRGLKLGLTKNIVECA